MVMVLEFERTRDLYCRSMRIENDCTIWFFVPPRNPGHFADLY
jgi:hypothetical protein